MDKPENELERELDRTLAEATAKIAGEEMKNDITQALKDEGVTFGELFEQTGASHEALVSAFEAAGIAVVDGSGPYSIPGFTPSRPYLLCADLGDLKKALTLLEDLAIEAHRPDVLECIRAMFFSEGMVYKYDQLLHTEKTEAYVHEGRALSLDTTWVVEIDHYDNQWRFAIRIPAKHFEALVNHLAQ